MAALQAQHKRLGVIWGLVLHPTEAKGATVADDVIMRANREGVETLKIDVMAGLTRAAIASTAPQHSEKRLRNRREARKAYDSVVGFIPRFELTPTDAEEINERLVQLKSALEKLGESFQ